MASTKTKPTLKTKSFSKSTYQYFAEAKKVKTKNIKSQQDWFLKNKSQYVETVKLPFENLLNEIQKKLQKEIPDLRIDHKLVTRPTRPAHKAAEGLVKNFSYATITEKRSSLFEWNPGIHIQFGNEKDDNFIGCGLYMVSGRQISQLRNAIATDFDTINSILKKKNFKSTWGTLRGEMYVRAPKGFAMDQDYSKLLMHKQFYVHREYKITEITSKKFADIVVQDLKIILPFFKWIRESVGTYKRTSVKNYEE
jgi:uncharacterized protein (TIGR02453 family)